MLCNYRMSGYGYEYQEGSRPDSLAIHLASSSHIWSLFAENHLTSRKAYLVIICLNSYEKLTKIKIRLSWSRFEHC